MLFRRKLTKYDFKWANIISMLVFVVASAIMIYNKLTGYAGKSENAAPTSWNDLVPQLPIILLSALFLAAVANVVTLWDETRREPDEH